MKTCARARAFNDEIDDECDESTPSKQDYMNTLKESVLLTQGDARVLPLRTSPGGCV